MKKLRLLLLLSALTSLSYAQNEVQITGTVTDELNVPLEGVSITIVGSTRGTVTGADGQYSITAAPADSLQYSYIEFETRTVLVGNRTRINIMLAKGRGDLDDITVVAFGRQKRTEVLGAVTTVKPEELRVPSSNLTHALAGRLAGLISYQRSGEPGRDNADFFIRGVTTFGYSNRPLILLDNFEISATEMARIDPNSIASFSIMKDATSTALYGARGANGVVLITTKEGRASEKIQVSFRHESSFSMPTQVPQMADGITFMKLYNEAFFNDNRIDNPTADPYYSAQKIVGTENNINPNVYPNVNWYDDLFTNHIYNQRYNLNVSGGGNIAQYFISASYNNDNGILKVDKRNNFNSNISIDRYNLRTNININLTPTTRAAFKLNGIFNSYNGPIPTGNSIFASVINSNPVDFPKYFEPDEEHQYVKHILFGRRLRDGVNPYADMVTGYQDNFESTILGLFNIDQNLSFITPGLKARASANIQAASDYGATRRYAPYYYTIREDDYDLINDKYILTNVVVGNESLGDPQTSKNASTRTYFETAINYDKAIGLHNVSGMVVYTQSELQTSSSGSIEQTLPYRNQGLAGRFTYNFDQRYMTEFNFGYNGSERFSKNNRFGFFPSFGVGYVVSREKFWEPLSKILSFAKLKYTYGFVGNDAIGAPNDRFFYLSQINQNFWGHGYRFGETFNFVTPGFSINRYSNFDITWEESLKQNMGIELKVLNTFTLMVDYFTELRKNIFMRRADMPAELGLSAGVNGNIGEVKAQGVDASLDFDHSFKDAGNTWVQGRFNFTYAANKILVYSEPFYRYSYLSRIGYPVDQQWGYIYGGIFVDDKEIENYPTQNFGTAPQPGDIRYLDVNGDGVINSYDLQPIGSPTVPEVIYGFGLSAGHRWFDLSFFFQGSARSTFFLNPNAVTPFVNNRNILKIIADDYWSPDNPNPESYWPRLSTQYVANNAQFSDKWLRDGTFLRLKNLEIGFTPDKNLLRRWGVRNTRFFVNGANLLVLSKFKLWDPEMGANGLGYPIQKTYNLGVQLDF